MDAFAALADPTRRDIVEMLATRGQLSAGEIGAGFASSAPAISQHLKVLRETALVTVEKQAQRRLYSLNPAALDPLEQWIAQMRRHWNERFDALDALLKREKSRGRKPRRRKEA